MRFLALAVGGLCVIGPVVAHAGPTAADLMAKGEGLAKDGRYTESIVAFKASNALRRRAMNYCLIGLSYTRRELWSQAEIMIDLCKKYATPDEDPLPDWLPVLEQTLAERLATVEVAPVELIVEPAGAPVTLSVSSFAPDEIFGPRTIHLAAGRHVVVATAEGYQEAQRTIEIADRSPQRIVITLVPKDAPPAVVIPAQRRTGERASKVPYVVMGGGAALLVVGAIYHATVFREAANQLADATDSTPDAKQWDAWQHRFDVRRTATLAFYGAGALAVGLGVVLKYTVYKDPETDVQLSAAPIDRGGIVSVRWTR